MLVLLSNWATSFNLAIEDRFTITKDDLLDGQRWAEQAVQVTPVLTRDYDTYNFLLLVWILILVVKQLNLFGGLTHLIMLTARSATLAWWSLPKPVLPDADGDGVTDQFDQEQTPAGAPVDTHGVSRDTDGDGVPDCKDKELITPTYCQPVDADGVGKCPCPDSLLTGRGRTDNWLVLTNFGALPSITFTETAVTWAMMLRALLASCSCPYA